MIPVGGSVDRTLDRPSQNASMTVEDSFGQGHHSYDVTSGDSGKNRSLSFIRAESPDGCLEMRIGCAGTYLTMCLGGWW